MANFHFQSRKLLNDSLPTPPSSCEGVCNSWNGGNCPPACISLCPAFCKPSIFSLPPPPPPPPCPPPPPPDSTVGNLGKPRQLSTLLIASLAVLTAAFFLFTCYTIYKFYTVWRSSSRRRRQPSHRRQEDGDDFFDEEQMGVVDHPIWYIRTIGLRPSVINAITIVKYKKGEGLVEGTDCAVCLSEFEEDETLRLLPKCNHAFHIPCIDMWLGSHTNCPMCRAGIVSNQSGPLPREPVSAYSGLPEETRSESVSVGIEDYSGVEMSEDVEEGDCKVDVGGLDGVQPSRRSVSMDSSSASMIMANAFLHCDAERVGLNGRLSKLVESPEVERCMQTGSSSIKRSVSCSANVFTSRYSSSNRSSN